MRHRAGLNIKIFSEELIAPHEDEATVGEKVQVSKECEVLSLKQRRTVCERRGNDRGTPVVAPPTEVALTATGLPAGSPEA